MNRYRSLPLSLAAATLLSLILSVPCGAFDPRLHRQVEGYESRERDDLPRTAGPGLLLSAVSHENVTLIYRFIFQTAKTNLGDLGPVKNSYFQSEARTKCGDQELLAAINRGMRIMYEYRDFNRKPVFNFLIDKKTCMNVLGFSVYSSLAARK